MDNLTVPHLSVFPCDTSHYATQICTHQAARGENLVVLFLPLSFMQRDPHQSKETRRRRRGNSITYLLSLQAHWDFFAPHHMGFQLLPLSQVSSLGLELVAHIPEEGSTSCSAHTPDSCIACQSNNDSTRNFFINHSNCPWPPLGAPHLQPEQLLEPRCLSLRINQ